MKNTKKLLVGVLSVAALLGTGVAAWTIGGGLTSHSETLDPTVVETIGTRDIELNVAKKDSNDTIVFDSTPDLDITYTVKAVAADGAADGFDPYDLTNFKKVAEEYQPDLTIRTKAYDVTNPDERVELKSDDPFYQYVKLPEVQTVDYDIWLASEEKGYDVELTFAWSDKYGNPQEYVDSELAAKSADEQRAFIENMIAALENVQFEFVFEVKGVKEDVPPVSEETGTVTLPTVDGSTLAIEGYDAEKGTVPVGTQTITITTEPGKIVEGNLTVVENGTDNEVTLTESLTKAATHTYTAEYDFKAGATYSFRYTVTDEKEDPEPVTKYAVSYTNEGTNGTITVTNEAGNVTSGATVEENTKITVKVTANEGFKIDTVTVGEEVETVGNTTFEKEYTVTSDLTISAVYSETSDEPADPMAAYGVFQSGKFGTYNKSLKASYYFTGEMDSYYLATNTNYDDGVVVTSYKDAAKNDYYLRFTNSENAYKYIGAEYKEGYYNILIQDTPYAWSYDETYKAYTTIVNEKQQFIGSYTYNTLSLQEYQYIEENSIAIITDEEIVVEVTDVKISASSDKVEVEKSITLSSTITPDYAPGEVTYEVLEGGTGEVSIDGSKVTGVKEGTVQIVGKVGNVTSDPITITVIANSGTPEVVEYSYTLQGDEGFNVGGGEIELNGRKWTYDATEAFNKGSGDYSGLQIGTSKKPLKTPWTIKTDLPDGAVIYSYTVTLNTTTQEKDGVAKYLVTLGEHKKEGTFNRVGTSETGFTPTIVSEESLSADANEFSITLSADKAVYLCSISFTYYVA